MSFILISIKPNFTELQEGEKDLVIMTRYRYG